MANRSRFNEFEQYRAQYNASSQSPNSVGFSEDAMEQGLLYSSQKTGGGFRNGGKKERRGSGMVSMEATLPPPWVDILEDTRENIEEIENELETLRNLHYEHLNPVIGKKQEEEEQDIAILTNKIKNIFKECQENVKKIGQYVEGTPNEERKMRENAQRSLVTQLNDLSNDFRREQREYLQKLRGMKSKTQQFTVFDEEEEAQDEIMQYVEQHAYDPGFSEEQLRELASKEQAIRQRDQELASVLESIIELQDMFKDLSQMVIDQGTLLDRIDYNIEQTYRDVEKGREEVEKASNYQKKSRMLLCILILVILLAILGLALAIKIFLKIGITI